MRFIYLLLLSAFLQFTSCEKSSKNSEEYLPEISLSKVEIQANGSVLVQGQVHHEGAAPLEKVGFSCGTTENHSISDRQIILEPQGDQFSAVYYGFHPNKPYYFTCWATNKYGYTQSQPLGFAEVAPLRKSAPCQLPLNTFSGGLTNGDTVGLGSSILHMYDWAENTAIFSNSELGIYLFVEFPVNFNTGVYTTTSNPTPDFGELLVTTVGPIFHGKSLPGQQVYINRVSYDYFEVSCCDLTLRSVNWEERKVSLKGVFQIAF